jgi:hypothetical protein
MFARQSCVSFFEYSWLGKFISACRKIETDPNYQPYATDKEINDLFMDQNGNIRNIGKSVLTIQPFFNNPNSITKNPDGMLYLIKIKNAFWGCIDDIELHHAYVKELIVVLVDKKGRYSFYNKESAEKGEFNSPLLSHDINDFLNQECLHNPEKSQNTTDLPGHKVETIHSNQRIARPQNLLNSHLLFQSLERSFLIENRHHDNNLQREYDKRFGLIPFNGK